jgi:hypothetical protein
MFVMASESTPLNSMAARSLQGIGLARSVFLTTTPLPSASRPRPKLRTASTTNTAANNRNSGSHHHWCGLSVVSP